MKKSYVMIHVIKPDMDPNSNINYRRKIGPMAELPTSNSLDLKLALWFSTVWPQNLRSEWEIGYSLDTPSCFQLSAYMKQQGGIRK